MEPRTPEEWAIQFSACNEILAGVGMEAYQLSNTEENPVAATIEVLKERQRWIDEEVR